LVVALPSREPPTRPDTDVPWLSLKAWFQTPVTAPTGTALKREAGRSGWPK
jgi:hypothetical protein